MLKLSSVTGIGINNQLSIRQMFCEYEPIDRRDHDVLVAMHNKNAVFEIP